MGGRSFYIDRFSDEINPCEPTLEGWAKWLSTPDEDHDYGIKHGEVADGATFPATATLWAPDIIASRADGQWTLSRDPAEDDFIAVRFGEGLGWSADQIISEDYYYNPESGKYERKGTLGEALIAWLTENDQFCDDREFIACGKHENGWILTFHAGQEPSRTAERAQ